MDGISFFHMTSNERTLIENKFTFDLQRFDGEITISSIADLKAHATDKGNYYELTNGTYTVTASATIDLDKPLVITGNVTLNLTKGTTSNKTTIKDVTGFTDNDSIGALIKVAENASLNVIGGGASYSAISATNPTIAIKSEGTLTIDKSNVECTATGGIGIESSGTLTIKSGAISGTQSIVNKSSVDKSTISGGMFNGDVTKSTIYGGTFNGDVTNSTINGGTFKSDVTNSTINGGTFNSETAAYNGSTISGGTFKTEVTASDGKTYKVTLNGTTKWYVSQNDYETALTTALNSAYFSSGSGDEVKYYTTLGNVNTYVTDGETITLIKDTSATESIDIDKDKNWTLDLNGHTLTMIDEGREYNYIFGINTENVHFTVKDSSTAGTGKIVNDSTMTLKNGLVYVSAGGEFTLESGTLESSTYAVSVAKNSAFNMSGGTIEISGAKFTYNGIEYTAYGVLNEGGTVNVSGGTVNSKGYGVNNSSGTFNLTGGTVKGGNESFTLNNDGKTYKAIGICNNGTLNISNDASLEGQIGVQTSGSSAKFTMDGGTITSTDLGVGVFGMNSTFNMNGGSITAEGFGIANNGTNDDDNKGTVINISGGSVTSTNSLGIYNPAVDSTLTISGTAEITGTTGVEIRAGKLTVSGDAKISSTVSDNFTYKQNGSGSTSSGAAIAVVQHTTDNPITVTVEGNAEMSGSTALGIVNPHDRAGTAPSISISGGTFKSTSSATEETVTSEDATNKVTGKEAVYNSDTRVMVNISGGNFDGNISKKVADDNITEQDHGGNYNITGGTFNSDISSYLTNGTATAFIDGETKYFVSETDKDAAIEACVAKVDGGSKIKYFTTLQSAVDLAEATETVKLTKNVTVTSFVSVVTTVTLDLNGKTISRDSNNPLVVNSGGNLTLTDSSTEQTGKVSGKSNVIYIGNGGAGTFTLAGGTIEATAGNGILVTNGSTANISGGTVEATAGNGIVVTSGSNATMNNGSINASDYAVSNSGKFTMTGGTVSNKAKEFTYNDQSYSSFGVLNNGGTFEMSGGTVQGGTVGIYNSSGTVEMNGETGGIVSKVNMGVYSVGGSLTLYKGTITADSIGVFGQNGFSFTMNDGNINVENGSGVQLGRNRADYNTSDSFTMTGGAITAESGVILFNGGEKFTMSGGTIKTDSFALSNNGNSWNIPTEIKISGGTLTATSTPAVYHAGSGTLEIGGTAEITGATGVEIRAGELTVTGGTIEGKGTSYTSEANSSGSTSSGAGIAVAQHTTNQKVTVNISGYSTKISGATALAVDNPEGNTTSEEYNAVSVEVGAGTFTSTATDGNAVYSDDNRVEVKLNGGKFEGNVTTGDNVTDESSAFDISTNAQFKKANTDEAPEVPKGYVLSSTAEGGYYKLIEVAQVGSNTYYNLFDAIAEATKDGATDTTVILLVDISLSETLDLELDGISKTVGMTIERGEVIGLSAAHFASASMSVISNSGGYLFKLADDVSYKTFLG